MVVRTLFRECLGKFSFVVSIRHLSNENLAGRANDFAARLRAGDLIQRSQCISLRKRMEEKQTWPKYTSSELIVNVAENSGNRLKNRS